MINKVLTVLQDQILNYLTLQENLISSTDDSIRLTNIVDNIGNFEIMENSLGLTLVNIEEERVMKSQKSFATASNGQIAHVNPEIKLNLYILISARFAEYKTSLQYISEIFLFFQGKSVFTPENTPGLHSSIEKIIVELFTLDFEQQNHLWGTLGAKYIPSILYKLRMVIIQSGIIDRQGSPISIINISSEDK